MDTATLGSDSWSDEPRYQAAYRTRLDFVLAKAPVLTLQQLASSQRNGVECAVSHDFAAGDFNLVKKITFIDGMQWIVRIRLPPISYFSTDTRNNGADEPREWSSRVKCTERDLEALKSEIVTMKYLEAKSTIPIPRVHAYSISNENKIGFPYIMMDYIHGTTAFNLSVAAGNGLTIPGQYVDHYYAQIADIMVELASFQFNQIGSLVGNLSSNSIDEYTIGPIAETGEGPYDTANDFYTSYPAALARSLYNDSTAPGSGGSETICRLPVLLNTARKASYSHKGLYSLANLELGTHNVLVNTSFDVLGVIDWDTVIAVPSTVLHQFPWCIGGDPGIPGLGPIPAFGDWDKRMEMCKKFAEVVESVANRRAKEGQMKIFSANEFFSKEALTFRALAFFRVKQNWVDEQWGPGLVWLHNCSDYDILRWYGIETGVSNNY